MGPMSPPLDELRFVFCPLMKQWFNVEFVIALRRRGFYPRGGGEVCAQIYVQFREKDFRTGWGGSQMGHTGIDGEVIALGEGRR